MLCASLVIVCMTAVTIRLTPEQNQWLDSQCSQFRKKSAVIWDLIDMARQELDTFAKLPAYRVGAGYTGNPETKAQQENEADLVSASDINSPSTNFEKVTPVTRSKRPQGAAGGDRVGMESEEGKSKGRVWKKEFRPNLQCHADLILQFWDTKAGAKSKAAWELLQTELTKIQERYGDQPLRAQLELGAANRWKSVTLKNYELYGMKEAPAQKPQEQEFKHPAHRVFTAKDGFGEPTTNPVLQELF